MWRLRIGDVGQSFWFQLSFLYSFLKLMWKLSECLPILKVKIKIDVEVDFLSGLLSLSPRLLGAFKEHLTVPLLYPGFTCTGIPAL